MASNTISVGDYGRWRGHVNFGGRTPGQPTKSRILISGDLINDGNQASNRNGIGWSVSGSGSRSGTADFSVPAFSTREFFSTYVDIDHDGTSTKTVTFHITLGNTGSITFGSGGTVTVSLSLPRVPAAPAAPSIGTVTSDSIPLSWSAPDARGSAITGYDIQHADTPGMSGAVLLSQGTSTSRTITGLSPGARRYMRVRAKNAVGAGAWSPVVDAQTIGGFYVGQGGAYVPCEVFVGVGGDYVTVEVLVGSGGSYVPAG